MVGNIGSVETTICSYDGASARRPRWRCSKTRSTPSIAGWNQHESISGKHLPYWTASRSGYEAQMLFLIEYDRPSGRLIRVQQFDASDRARADDARLDLELALNRDGTDREVVVLEAASEQALRRTHRRHFEDLAGIARSFDRE